MIKSIVKFITGEVIKTNQTNGTVYLSDGTHWKNSKFHENVSLIRAFMYREVQQSDAIKEIQREIDNAKIVLTLKRQNAVRKMRCVKHQYSLITCPLKFGKYKGEKVCDVAEKDLKYLNWYFQVSATSVDTFLEQSYANV